MGTYFFLTAPDPSLLEAAFPDLFLIWVPAPMVSPKSSDKVNVFIIII